MTRTDTDQITTRVFQQWNGDWGFHKLWCGKVVDTDNDFPTKRDAERAAAAWETSSKKRAA